MGNTPRGAHCVCATVAASLSIVRRQALGEQAARVVPGQLLHGDFRAAAEASNGGGDRLQIHLQECQPRSKDDDGT